MGVNIQTIKDIRSYLVKELKEIYQEQEITALVNIIIKTLFDVTKLHQLYIAEQQVTSAQILKIIEICNELKTGKPIQYIFGETSFYDCIIKVKRSILIPRQETEELVDLIIKENKGYAGNIIDFGTGSGCIAIALAANLPESSVTATDISEEAIMIAKENASLNNVNVTFIKADILGSDNTLAYKAGIIVSNPPYVRNSEKQFMSRNVLDFEPYSALFVTDNDPLVFYKAIIMHANKILLPGGSLYFEINEAMGKAMSDLLKTAGYSNVMVIADLNGKDRIIKGRKDA